ncbi:hypothetical protein FJT64_021076 [Amphibalanus amphitrite]|uniref:Uncharacterized protein n=1 Tax=Amphibalanus amphitrite TaxID=1232801 RepID=A0A6A4WUX4_AMPAM|nr:hypothetical protein FJT64_021076 [Amphibalanus amphitrite]
MCSNRAPWAVTQACSRLRTAPTARASSLWDNWSQQAVSLSFSSSMVVLAVLCAVSAERKFLYHAGVVPSFYSGLAPFPYAGHAVTYSDKPATEAVKQVTYAAHPVTYAAHPVTYPVTYAAYPYIHGLPLSFKPAEEKAAEEKPAEATPVVESRSKRSAEEDQKAEDATYVSTYAAHPYPLTYSAGYPYTYPTVYSAGYSPLAYHGCTFGIHGCTVYNGVYHSLTVPVVHSIKKRDVSDAEDQQADEATYVSTYAAHPYPLTYSAGYTYNYNPTVYRAPAVYTTASTAFPYSGFGYPYRYYI